MYAGVDWAGKSWFVVFLENDGSPEGAVYPTLWNLWRDRGDEIERLLIDIPIGLCRSNKRACDVEAKEYVGGTHQRSVFYTPIRDAVAPRNIEMSLPFGPAIPYTVAVIGGGIFFLAESGVIGMMRPLAGAIFFAAMVKGTQRLNTDS